jgi:hypothetical protein
LYEDFIALEYTSGYSMVGRKLPSTTNDSGQQVLTGLIIRSRLAIRKVPLP